MPHPSEDLAVAYLTQQGFHVVCRNFKSRHGELDIVARRTDEWHFIEVKSRQSADFGRPEEYVTVAKQRRLRHAAMLYAAKHNLNTETLLFDVVAIDYFHGKPRIEVFENAF